MIIRIKENQLESIEGLHPDYPYVCHHFNLNESKVPWHWHEEVEFDYILSGSIQVQTTGKTYTFTKNEAFFINTNVLCTMRGMNSPASPVMDSHLFHPVYLGGHFKSLFQTKYLDPVLQDRTVDIVEIRGENPVQKELLRKLRQVSFLQDQKDVEFQTRNLMSEIWLLLRRELQNKKTHPDPARPVSQDRIQSMMTFIHENYYQKLTLEEIAASAMISKRECLRCFREQIGKPPFEYLADYRLEIAEKLLKTTDLSVTEIALQTGFSGAAYFCKIFKAHCDMTPGMYRKNSRR